MSQYKVDAEVVVLHSAIVEAESPEEAVDAYMEGEFVEDLGETFPADETFVVNVEGLD